MSKGDMYNTRFSNCSTLAIFCMIKLMFSSICHVCTQRKHEISPYTTIVHMSHILGIVFLPKSGHTSSYTDSVLEQEQLCKTDITICRRRVDSLACDIVAT